MSQLLVLALDVLLATTLSRFVFEAEAAAFPVLDGHQNAIVATDQVGAVPVAELEGRDLFGERPQRSRQSLLKSHRSSGQRASAGIQQLHILRCHLLAPEAVEGGVDTEHALCSLLACDGNTESDA